jgi:hypothetical protein
VEQILTKYGSKDVSGIKYAAFREFMVDLLGVSDTKDDIINSFTLINKSDGPVAKVATMEIVMDAEDIDYIKQTAPKLEDGYDYKTWTNAMFSR